MTMGYEPKTGDLVTHPCEGICVVTAALFRGVSARKRDGREVLLSEAGLVPIRPDALGQRVRAFVSNATGVTIHQERTHDCEWFVVRWEDGSAGPWATTNLIRVADQAPAASPSRPDTAWHERAVRLLGSPSPSEAPRPETQAADAPVYMPPAELHWTPGPTCQHCGSLVLVGLLADTCPRGCDLRLRAAEPEPEVDTMPWEHAAHICCLEEHGCAGEVLYVARTPGTLHPGYPHPTREGAIAAWREAVRR